MSDEGLSEATGDMIGVIGSMGLILGTLYCVLALWICWRCTEDDTDD